jgi:urea transport system permease protein
MQNKSSKQSIYIEGAIVVFLGFLMIFILPLIISSYQLNLVGRFLGLAIAALGIDLIWGYTGLLSLGNGIFFALGGYAIAMYLKLQIPAGATSQLPEFMNLYGVEKLPWFWYPFYSFPFTVFAILFIPAIFSALVGYLVFRNRIKGVYFSILTQAATIVFFNFFNGQQKLFNGTNGLTDFQSILGFDVSNSKTQWCFYSITILLLISGYLLCRYLTNGRFGKILLAIRDDESRVRFSGYNPTGFKVLVFAIAAMLAGVGGAMFTIQTGLISPKSMDIAFSIEMVIWVAVGGRATLIGAIIGALLVNLAKSYLSDKFPDIWLFFQGGIFLLVVTILPQGLIGLIQSFSANNLLSFFNPKKISIYSNKEE